MNWERPNWLEKSKSMKIHYISSFVETDFIGTYRVAPSVAAKVGYVKNALKQSGYDLSLFCIACTTKGSLVKSKRVVVDEKESQYYPFSVGGKNGIQRIVSYFFIYVQLFIFLFKVEKGDSVLLYHSPNDTRVVKFFNRLLNKRIFLELEELYTVLGGDNNEIAKEKKVINRGFAGYIVVNTLITHRCDIEKPCAICEGQYIMLSKVPKSVLSEDKKIHVVYAGLFLEGQDVYLAIKSAAFLNENYIMHIAGYGDDTTVAKVISEIDAYNCNNSGCRIEYHGCLHGEAYEELLSRCSVGLCTRVLEDSLSDYTFPSKVFAYLARNIMVICTPISCVKYSPIADNIIFTRTATPEEVSRAILSLEINNVIDNTSMLQFQNTRFVNEVSKLFA